MFNTIPKVGDIVDYYSLPTLRVPAIVVEVFQAEDICSRPHISLFAFYNDGKNCFFQKVPPVDSATIDDETLEPSLKGRWGFAHEFAILQKDVSSPLGTQTNEHVGSTRYN
jgi:hypothetical protein